MSNLPTHPDTNDDHPDVTAAVPATSRRRRAVVIAAVVALIAVFVVLHLTGVVGSESH
jgi:hypothetical protein